MRCLTLGILVAAALSACGGGGGSNPTPITTTTTTLPPSFSGTYSGPMLFNVAGLAEVRVTGRTTVTQNGNSLDFTALALTGGGLAPSSWSMGNATLNGNVFMGGTTYQSSGCGLVVVTTTGRFAGNLMNLTALLDPQTCDNFELRGELSK